MTDQTYRNFDEARTAHPNAAVREDVDLKGNLTRRMLLYPGADAGRARVVFEETF